MASWIEQTLLPQVLRIHDTVYRGTNGWIGHRTLGIPSLLLHTVGAKTGFDRTTSLTYARDGNDYLIVASKGGDPKAPGWYHNLRKNPDVEINVGPRRFGVTARPVVPGDTEYARLWQIVNKNNGNRYTAYQEKTSRPIPVVVLSPQKAG
jgi:deazaflavin-dependent oxidoreductase (nitroreductase family)